MYYQLQDIEIVKIPEGKANAGQKYVRATVFNPRDLFERSSQIALFEEKFVRTYERYLPASKGGTAAEEGYNESTSLPLQLREFKNGRYVQYPLGQPMFRKHTRAIPSKGIQIGDWVKDSSGKAKVYNYVQVLCKYDFDRIPVIVDGVEQYDQETGRPLEVITFDANGKPIEHWVNSWSPEERGAQLRDNQYFSISSPDLPRELIPEHLLPGSGVTVATPAVGDDSIPEEL